MRKSLPAIHLKEDEYLAYTKKNQTRKQMAQLKKTECEQKTWFLK